MQDTTMPTESANPVLADVEELSRQFATNFYQQEAAWCLAQCAPTVCYIGNTIDGYARNLDEFTSLMSVISQLFLPGKATFLGSWSQMMPGGNLAVVGLRFIVTSDLSTGSMRAGQKRATFVWQLDGEKPLLLHLHMSTLVPTMRDQKETNEATRDTYLYAQAVLDRVIRIRGVSLRDIEGVTHFLSSAEVRYVEADRQHTIVHTLRDPIVVRRGFRDIINEFGDDFVVVHRSFAVNPLFVQRVEGASAFLDNGTEIPLSQRRVAKVRATLVQAARQLLNETKLPSEEELLNEQGVYGKETQSRE